MEKITKNKNHYGFYLVEAIIAIFLLAVGLLAAVGLISKVMSNNMTDRDNAIAVLLSQEGIELVRNLRDNKSAKGLSAFDSTSAPQFPVTDNLAMRIDKSGNLENSASYVLSLDNTKFYVHTGGVTSTKFQRRISVDYNGTNCDGTSSDSDCLATITSTVIWKKTMTDFPVDNTLASKCTASAGCTYAQVKLTRWQ
jgi:Tfp pilus assembly protein PilV